jgi:hypothetical protein
MPLMPFNWPRVSDFRNRVDELRRLEAWWESPTQEPIALSGRRRVGKSWLLNRFAHGKPAVLLVADRVAPGMQLDRLSAQLGDLRGVTPRLADAADLVRALYRLGREIGSSEQVTFPIAWSTILPVKRKLIAPIGARCAGQWSQSATCTLTSGTPGSAHPG